MPDTSSLLLKRIRTGMALSIRYRRYFTSSKVCSGAFVFALLTASSASLPKSRSTLIGLPIVSATRADPQTAACRSVLDGDLQGMKAIFGGRDVLGIKADQVLRAQLAQDVVEGTVQLRAQAGS